jgi:predicted phage terminase large subunit-like protein
MNRNTLEERYRLLKEKRIRFARLSFWEFCKLLHKDFYTDDKSYLKDYCQVLEDLYKRNLSNPDDNNEPYTRACISFPPRHGKSRTLILFCCWCFGQSIANSVLYLSYSDDSAVDFSRYVRDEISRKRETPEQIIFNDIFPQVNIKKGDASVQKWSLEGRHFSYKASGIGGGITGKGATIIIIDDPIKNSYEAFNKTRKAEIINWIKGTVLSRAEGTPLEIINMTRWASDDPIGVFTSGLDGKSFYIYQKNAQDEQGNMLCESVLSKKRFEFLRRNADPAIFQANYFNKLIDENALMYPVFKRFSKLEHRKYEKIINATDTADKGTDYFSSPVAKIYQGDIYIWDWLFTQEDTTKTPSQFVDLLVNNKVEVSRIESNAGGNIFKNWVDEKINNNYPDLKIEIETFPQTKNKEARIRDMAYWIINHVYFPDDFHITHPLVWKALTEFLRVGKNEHDDAPDSLTILAEMVKDVEYDPYAGL